MAEKGFWSRIFGGSPNDEMPTHSFEELQRIHNVLLDPANQVVNAFNKATLIETLRELAELLIWGDQNDSRVFEYFLEHNMLKHYKRILAVPSHRRGDVAVQLLQVCAPPAAPGACAHLNPSESSDLCCVTSLSELQHVAVTSQLWKEFTRIHSTVITHAVSDLSEHGSSYLARLVVMPFHIACHRHAYIVPGHLEFVLGSACSHAKPPALATAGSSRSLHVLLAHA